MVKKRKDAQEITTVVVQEPATVEDEHDLTNSLRTVLEEISKYDGTIGYILRNTTSATIDLKDPTKIVDYAILSSSTFDASKEFSELFNLGNIENTLVEGKETKMLFLSVGENKISVFMEKNVDCEKILKRLQTL